MTESVQPSICHTRNLRLNISRIKVSKYILYRTIELSSTQKFLSVPPHNLDTTARRFSVAAPRLWNSLPLNCRTAPSVNTFKTRLN